MKILIVDDDLVLRRTLAISIRAEGHDVLVAADGRTALEAARDDRPDLMVLDLGLPDLSGVQVLRELRRWSRLPVVVLSARNGSDDKVAALDEGADDYVTKPFGNEELLARIRATARRSGSVVQVVETESLRIDVAGAAGHPRRGRRTTHPHGVGDPRGAGPPTGEAGHAAGPAARGLGAGLRARDQLPAGPHGQPAQEARGRPLGAAAPRHRARDGLPLRALSKAAHCPKVGILPDAGCQCSGLGSRCVRTRARRDPKGAVMYPHTVAKVLMDARQHDLEGAARRRDRTSSTRPKRRRLRLR